MSLFKNWLGKEALDMVSNASTIGLHMVSGTFVGLAMGYFLDEWVVWTKPWLTMGFLLIGIAAGFKNVWIDVKRIQRAQARQDALAHQAAPDAQGQRDMPPRPSEDGQAEGGQRDGQGAGDRK
jgi:ATP synthase protein I